MLWLSIGHTRRQTRTDETTRDADQIWEHLCADFLGPLPSGDNVFVIVDYYSRWKEGGAHACNVQLIVFVLVKNKEFSIVLGHKCILFLYDFDEDICVIICGVKFVLFLLGYLIYEDYCSVYLCFFFSNLAVCILYLEHLCK